ncbi:DNA cytosine methyltransferase [Paenibacillus oralis]|uniref:DNA (cytosine-5-)-methyltransferase n=1 Tax=Paenibacillus oralis TaxID=2490856 RepID=A0A3P3TC25_9BACL|nr:DNA cytosine methyltransferase [Paenibacillus oralis]RRJ54658.1 DNA cytosine methyltransferase [Paenibacillus oralis]
MKSIKMVRNLKTTERDGNTRLYFEPSVLEEAGFNVGESVKISIQQDSIILFRAPDEQNSDGIISRRLRRGWEKARPYFDRSNAEISSVLRAKERIDIIIREGHITVRHERSFDLTLSEGMLQGEELQKLRLLSLPSGMGMATAALVNTSLYEAVGAIDMWPIALDVYRFNFRNGISLMSDIKHLHPAYIPQADVVILSPECDEFSALGTQKANVATGLAPHYARLIWATNCNAVLIEQVAPYFKSRAYHQLRTLLIASGFNRFYETQICAHDFGSVAGRRRGYAVAFHGDINFVWPTPPRIPDRFRKTVGQVLGNGWEERGQWSTIENSPMEKLLAKKKENNNFNADRNYTLVDLDSKRISAVISAYRRTQVTSSYLRHPDGKHWRQFTSDELGYGFLSLPDWFEWPDGGYVSETRKVELIGQGVDCTVLAAIGSELAVSLIGEKVRAKREDIEPSLLQNRSGQLELIF